MNFNLTILGLVFGLVVCVFIFMILHKAFRQLATKTNYAGVKQMLVCFYAYFALLIAQIFIENMESPMPVLLVLVMVIGSAVLLIFVFAFKSFVEDVVARHKK